GDRVVHGGAGTVAVRDAVDVPGRGEQGGGAGAPGGGSGGDVADGQVDRGGRGHGVLLHQGAGSWAGRWITGRSGARCQRGGWTHRGGTGGRGGGGRRSGIRRWPPADPSSPSDGGSSRGPGCAAARPRGRLSARRG